jgi:hypothetical protein
MKWPNWICKYFLGVALLFLAFTPQKAPMITNSPPCQFIYLIDVAVKSKRPDKNHVPLWKYALLYVCKDPTETEVQRRVITVKWEKQTYHEEIVKVEKVFETRQEALDYATANKLAMAYFEDDPERVAYPPVNNQTKKN